MERPTNASEKETANNAIDTNAEKFVSQNTEEISKKKSIETEEERAFKEGLGNNSDTDKNSMQQK